MFKENTLFVVGAGASHEFGLPIGSGLSETIRQNSIFKLDHFNRLAEGNHALFGCLKNRYPITDQLSANWFNDLLGAFRRIHDSIYLASSIDNFIDMHFHDPHIADLGKLQIAFSILNAERKSKLFFDANDANSRLDLPTLNDTWIDAFTRILFESIRNDNLDAIFANISIICFNYDRCIEHYLIEAIRQTFAEISYEDAHKIVSQLNIIHPYGTLGGLPQSFCAEPVNSVPFGFDVESGFDPWPVLEHLKTYTEQVEDKDMIALIRGAVTEAEQMVFLGFAFHPQNMELMKLDERTSLKRVYSTGRGISRQEEPEIVERILKLYAGDANDSRWRENVHIEHGMTCAELFGAHWRNLSVA